MKIFAKVFTQFFNDPWVLAQNCNSRGLFLQLIIWAKMHGDTGMIHGRSWSGLGSAWGCDGKTARNLLWKFREEKKVALREDATTGVISLVVVNYRYYQGLDAKPGVYEDAVKALSVAEKSGEIPSDPSTIYTLNSSLKRRESRVEKSRKRGGKTPSGISKENSPPPSDRIAEVEPPKEEGLKFKKIMTIWNTTVREPVKRIKKMTPAREAKLRSRFKDSIPFEGEGEAWRELFQMVMRSDFLSGRAKKWACDFDFVIKSQDRIVKIQEGGYGNVSGGSRPEVGREFGGTGSRQL